jgi:hypothetical protein
MEGLIELLLVVAEIFFEAFIESAAAALVDLALRALTRIFPASHPRPEFAALGYAFLGAVAGGLSVFVVPHPLVRPSRFHGISVVVSPFVTGLTMASVGLLLRRQGKKITGIESFAYGFSFALGMALVRYFFVSQMR